jgi:hypothetical protein
MSMQRRTFTSAFKCKAVSLVPRLRLPLPRGRQIPRRGRDRLAMLGRYCQGAHARAAGDPGASDPEREKKILKEAIALLMA